MIKSKFSKASWLALSDSDLKNPAWLYVVCVTALEKWLLPGEWSRGIGPGIKTLKIGSQRREHETVISINSGLNPRYIPWCVKNTCEGSPLFSSKDSKLTGTSRTYLHAEGALASWGKQL